MAFDGAPDSVALRSVTPADSEFIYNVRKSSFAHHIIATYGHWDEEQQRAAHEQRMQTLQMRIVTSRGRDIGYVGVRDDPDSLYLGQIFLLPEAQGRGIGSQVLSQVLEEGRQTGHPVTLSVLRVNTRAQEFYKRHGFVVMDETPTGYRMATSL